MIRKMVAARPLACEGFQKIKGKPKLAPTKNKDLRAKDCSKEREPMQGL
jgi:hypothetical protein